MTRQYSCSSCAFQIQSENVDELVDVVRTHADKMHNTTMSRSDVETGWQLL